MNEEARIKRPSKQRKEVRVWFDRVERKNDLVNSAFSLNDLSLREEKACVKGLVE